MLKTLKKKMYITLHILHSKNVITVKLLYNTFFNKLKYETLRIHYTRDSRFLKISNKNILFFQYNIIKN